MWVWNGSWLWIVRAFVWIHQVPFQHTGLNAVTSPQFDFSKFPPRIHVYTHIFRWVVYSEKNIGYCPVLLLLTETGWLWYYQHCWMYCMHHRALAAHSAQHAVIGLSNFQLRFCQAALITKSPANACESVSENRTSPVTWFSAGWGEQMLLYVSSSFSPTVRESHSHNWVSSLCAGPQLYSCSRTITHDQDNINTSKLILQRRRERLQEQPSCQKPLLSCSPFRHWLFRSAF